MSRRPARTRDKWRLKKWYEVVAPQVFGSVTLGTTPADDPRKLIGRVMETTLYDITGDFSLIHVHLYLQIIDVDEENLKAFTRFKGHELARDYMKSLIRRKSSKVQGIYNVTTKDGYGLRITGVVLTTYRCKTSQKRAIRKVMGDIIVKRSAEMTLDGLIKAMLFGQLANEVFEAAKKIYPLRKVEIYKSKLLTVPGPDGKPQPAVVVSPLMYEIR
ncbi:30S ribosomal protein S3Ae [Pyrodictium occultum]|uniref:Small ribosomal subunit protein eS1 n=1 Tax=Pyrodictium occultum TaxID=2309 RepID=A0A0V8RTC3_PYROC|nr:30S ribosomal protein S3ae [Pyrodictium occultum]KSW11319.1 30S ribosomal protein S3Ae [Pyrodictium occultum]